MDFSWSLVLYKGSLRLFWGGFGPCMQGPAWGCIGFEQSLTRCLPELQRAFLVLQRGFCRWVQPAVTPDVCPQPPAGAAVGLVCVVLFPSPQGLGPCGVVLAPVGAACVLPCLRHGFGWTPAKVMLEGAGPQDITRAEFMVLARFVQVCWGMGEGAGAA